MSELPTNDDTEEVTENEEVETDVESVAQVDGIDPEDGIDSGEAAVALKSQYTLAEKILKTKESFFEFLGSLEEKLEAMNDSQAIATTLKDVPLLFRALKSWAKKEYTKFPWGTLVAIVAALLYVVWARDIIPDTVPLIGHVDDAAVVAFCLTLLEFTRFPGVPLQPLEHLSFKMC